MKHRFLADDQVSGEDIRQLIELTNDGCLRWQPSDNSYAYNAFPMTQRAADDAQVSAGTIGENLRGIRLGYDPRTREWHYLRLTSHGGNRYYVDEESGDELVDLVSQLHLLVLRAERLGGTIKSDQDKLHFCEQCGKETPHKHLIDSPHGIAGAIMAGSERLTCTACERSTSIDTLQKT